MDWSEGNATQTMDKRSRMTHHADGPDGHHAVTPVAVGPGIPTGVLSLLQHEHLSAHVLHLITHPAGE